jgi:hypothetical protein
MQSRYTGPGLGNYLRILSTVQTAQRKLTGYGLHDRDSITGISFFSFKTVPYRQIKWIGESNHLHVVK